MSDRCEPPEELRGQDGWHWVDADRPLICQWLCADEYQRDEVWKMPSANLYSPESAYQRGYRYLAPVTPPAEVARLRAEVERLTAKLADNRKGEEAVRSLKLLADMLRADGIAQHKDESNAQYVGRTLRTARADLARLVEAAERFGRGECDSTMLKHAACDYADTLTPPDPLEEAREALREIAACAPNPSPTLRWAHSALAALDRMKKDPAA